MKLECSREKLKQAISLAERVTGKNLSLAVLSRVLLSAKGNILVVRATNLDLGCEWRLDAKVTVAGEVLVSGSVLSNLLSSLGGVDKLILEVVKDNLLISVASSSTLVKVYPADDFPTLPEIDQATVFKMETEKFLQGAKAVAYAASLSDIKPEIASVYVFNEKQTFYFVATDSFRLAEKKITSHSDLETPNDTKLIIPIRNVTELLRLLENVSGEALWHYNRNQLNVVTEKLTISSRLIDGVFPDYRQIIPLKSTSQTTLDKSELIQALKLTQIFTDRLNHVTIKLRPEEKTLELTSQNGEVGEHTSFVTAALSGEELMINFNLRYLLDGLQSVYDHKLLLQFNGRTKPILLAGSTDNSFRYLIMPLNR